MILEIVYAAGRRRTLLGVLLLFVLVTACGGQGIEPNHPDCPSAAPTVAALCTDNHLACHWEDIAAQIRTWCWCRTSSWACAEEPL